MNIYLIVWQQFTNLQILHAVFSGLC